MLNLSLDSVYMYGVYDMSMGKYLSIGQLAKISGIGIETIRFYHRNKLLELPSTKNGSFRVYDESYVEKIDFIKKCQSVGFSLAEIKEFLDLKLIPQNNCEPVKKKTQKKITEVEFKIKELKKILKALKTFESRCNGKETAGKCSILGGLKGLTRG